MTESTVMSKLLKLAATDEIEAQEPPPKRHRPHVRRPCLATSRRPPQTAAVRSPEDPVELVHCDEKEYYAHRPPPACALMGAPRGGPRMGLDPDRVQEGQRVTLNASSVVRLYGNFGQTSWARPSRGHRHDQDWARELG